LASTGRSRTPPIAAPTRRLAPPCRASCQIRTPLPAAGWAAATAPTAPTWPTSSPARATTGRTRASHPARSSTRSRCAARSPPPAAAWRCCRPWSSPSIQRRWRPLRRGGRRQHVAGLELRPVRGRPDGGLGEAVRLGVVVACAAGNAADHPYIVSSPSIAPGAISVAQTQVPSASSTRHRELPPASPLHQHRHGGLGAHRPRLHRRRGLRGRGCPAGSISATTPTTHTPPTGRQSRAHRRGACAVSLKVDRAFAAGAIGVLIGLVAPGDAISFSYGGGTHLGPTLVSSRGTPTRSSGARHRHVNVTVHDSQPLVKSMVSSSARGPATATRPSSRRSRAGRLGFRGGGDRTFEAAFGGTSGATPMIAGSAALLLEAFPHASPAEIKARLMNNTETQIKTAPNLFGSSWRPPPASAPARYASTAP